jgi:hypothetical protein
MGIVVILLRLSVFLRSNRDSLIFGLGLRSIRRFEQEILVNNTGTKKTINASVSVDDPGAFKAKWVRSTEGVLGTGSPTLSKYLAVGSPSKTFIQLSVK